MSLNTWPEQIKISDIIETCSGWSFSKIVLFLEFPWVLLAFEPIISLSRTDISQYSRNILSFHNSTAASLQKIGACLFDLTEKNKKGLLCASLAPQSIKLIENLKKNKKIKIDSVPLLYACIPALLKEKSESILFHGINQAALVTKHSDTLQKIILLPESVSKDANEYILADYLNVSSKDTHTCQLIKQPAANKKSDISVSMFSIIERSNMGAKHSTNPFWWEVQRKSFQISWKSMTMLCWVGVMLILFVWYFSAKQSNERMKQQLNQSIQKLNEDQAKIDQFKEYIEKQNRFIQINTLYQHLRESSGVVKKMLEQLINPMTSESWIEQIKYDRSQMHLTLLTLKTSLIPEIIDQMATASIVKKIYLKSQQLISLNQQEIVKFTLQIDLKTNEEDTIPESVIR
ncbi:MAG: hypothetical protein HQM14_18385 [SAR324 cluster bacterium]|nr:hypothetical protein [SAR324 cluster bacterium]